VRKNIRLPTAAAVFAVIFEQLISSVRTKYRHTFREEYADEERERDGTASEQYEKDEQDGTIRVCKDGCLLHVHFYHDHDQNDGQQQDDEAAQEPSHPV
jgi:hypothetical protein